MTMLYENPSFSFAGEEFFQYMLPNHDKERNAIVMTTVITLTCITYIIPKTYIYLCQERRKPTSSTSDNLTDKESIQERSETQNKNATSKDKRRRGKNTSKNVGKNGDSKTSIIEERRHSRNEECSTVVELPFWISPPVVTLVFILVVLFNILTSPANTFSARGVFEAPLLTNEECDLILNMTLKAANVNYVNAKQQLANRTKTSSLSQLQRKRFESILDEPRGWTKDRHAQYPTTDLNVMTDGFTFADRAQIGKWLDARLAPLIGRVFGYHPSRSIRANDMFIVRYDGISNENNMVDGSKYQQHLSLHKDEGYVSFNVLLKDPNVDFIGGGTRFVSHDSSSSGKKEFQIMDVFPQSRGNVIIHHAMLEHEGMPTTNGTRIILVGFLHIERIDPLATSSSSNGEALKKTGLGWLASWGSLPWMHTTFKHGMHASYNRLEESRRTSRGDESNRSGRMQLVASSKQGSTTWKDTKYARGLFHDLTIATSSLMSMLCPLHKMTLISMENRTKYLRALDDAFSKKNPQKEKERQPLEQSNHHARWFEGQQIETDVDGSLFAKYDSRAAVEEQIRVAQTI